MDKEVDEKYYLSDEIVLKFLKTFNLTDKEPTNKVRQVGNIVTTGNFENPQRGRIYNPVGICPSLNTVGGGGLEPKVIVYDSYNSRVRADQKTIGTITTMIGRSSPRAGQKIIENYGENYRIRKLTPRECFALMGFQKEDADKLSGSGISNSQLYKQAGNSIVVNVLEEIFKNLKGVLYEKN